MVKYYSTSLDAVFAALSDPTRRAILARLIERDFAVSELAEPFDMSLPAVSKHLRVLESAGLVRREKVSRVVHCRLEAAPMEEAVQWLGKYQRFWSARLDALARYLEDSTEQETSAWPSSSPPNKPRSSSSATTRSRAKKCSARGPTRGR